ncbi:TPA: mechanosensitive ion channel family protein [Stenotrophomonas maltophilia]|uniref:Small-conductance mechanosensitive channel n=1 Tax=Stenotrophomonas maltophilia TaxID=40324 RepID=A0A2J0UEB2_STEMA|nr:MULTISPECIES: mechanosensitive ion channel family protein [Stenotrophomonas]PJL31773.1 mechanosensitive ion channel protein MscS [Stenotrophomonas maltophilia]HDS1136354.1 mechanosensitive ion channel family protein [Stenotrophomonas maltophilia]HDS1149039.1 mechanosensitive ion channel family protein [Stenotrophomonas maltophilia]HDS1162763.1 mechanosensitive ion channel family protein [Stenotrophomonas maltophilia]HEL5403944.1 mechanosensitive ion channel family protein [Stenotrophomonas 
MMLSLKDHLPPWTHPWLNDLGIAVKILLTLLAAWLLRVLARRLIRRFAEHYTLPPEMVMGARRITSFVVYFSALLYILSLLGASPSVLWTAFTGFAAVGAVAFFAAWSVLSNIFCTLLIFTTRPFRLHDYIEVLENGEKPGLKGRVIDVNLIYTTLQETGDGHEGTVLQLPNNLFFQRTVRRWRDPAQAPGGIQGDG